jgi:Xaa-Pro aminopeptidase
MAATDASASEPRFDPLDLNRERLAVLQSHLSDSEFGALLLFDPFNIRYATGLSNMQVFTMHVPIRHVLIVSGGGVHSFEFRHCEFMKDLVGTIDTIQVADSWLYMFGGSDMERNARRWASSIADIMRRETPRNLRIGVDRLDWMGAGALESYGMKVRSCDELLTRARYIKTPLELVAMHEGIASTEAGVREMEAMLAPDCTEAEAMGVFLKGLNAAGGEHLETRLLNSGERTNPWYQETSERRFRAGDFVCLDTDAIGKNGYCCDISRTFLVPGQKPNDQQRHVYALAYEHLQRVMSMIGPGVGLQEIAEKVGTPNDEYWTYTSIGHGCGMSHEYPVIRWDHRDEERYAQCLMPNSILCVESYCGWKKGGPGVKLEEQLLITETGTKTMSTLGFVDELVT